MVGSRGSLVCEKGSLLTFDLLEARASIPITRFWLCGGFFSRLLPLSGIVPSTSVLINSQYYLVNPNYNLVLRCSQSQALYGVISFLKQLWNICGVPTCVMCASSTVI